jgi:hypothetical protein
MTKVNDSPIGENSPNLVTLILSSSSNKKMEKGRRRIFA